MIKSYHKYNEKINLKDSGYLPSQDKLDYDLQFAININRLDMVKKAVEDGANVNFISNRNAAGYPFTPIIYTAIGDANSPEIVEYLVKKGADIEYKVPMGASWRALEYASHNMKLDIVKKLIELGTDIDYKPINNLDFIKLIKSGINLYKDLFLSYNYQKELIEINNRMYFKLKDNNCLNDKIKEEYKDLEDSQDLGLLFMENKKMFRNIPYQTNEELAPTYTAEYELCLAISNNRYDTFIEIMESGEIDINQVISQELKYNDEDTPLTYSTYYGNLNMVEYLLNNNADLEPTDKYGNTALLIAAEKWEPGYGSKDYWSIIKLLLEYGSDIKVVNKLDKSFVTINPKLHEIKQKEILDLLDELKEDYMMMLINNKINISPDIKKKYEDLINASDLGLFYKESVKNNNMEKVNDRFYRACVDCDIENIKKYLEKGADINFFDGEYSSLILVSKSNEEDEIKKYLAIKYLLEKGANPNFKDEKGEDFISNLDNIYFIRKRKYQKELIDINPLIFNLLKDNGILHPKTKEEFKDVEDASDLGLFYKENLKYLLPYKLFENKQEMENLYNDVSSKIKEMIKLTEDKFFDFIKKYDISELDLDYFHDIDTPYVDEDERVRKITIYQGDVDLMCPHCGVKLKNSIDINLIVSVYNVLHYLTIEDMICYNSDKGGNLHFLFKLIKENIEKINFEKDVNDKTLIKTLSDAGIVKMYNFQKIMFDNIPVIMMSLSKKYNINIHPNIQKEFADVINADDLGLFYKESYSPILENEDNDEFEAIYSSIKQFLNKLRKMLYKRIDAFFKKYSIDQISLGFFDVAIMNINDGKINRLIKMENDIKIQYQGSTYGERHAHLTLINDINILKNIDIFINRLKIEEVINYISSRYGLDDIFIAFKNIEKYIDDIDFIRQLGDHDRLIDVLPVELCQSYDFQKLMFEKRPTEMLKYIDENNIKIDPKIKTEYSDIIDAKDLGLFYKE